MRCAAWMTRWTDLAPVEGDEMTEEFSSFCKSLGPEIGGVSG
jgi:hypothetical protein